MYMYNLFTFICPVAIDYQLIICLVYYRLERLSLYVHKWRKKWHRRRENRKKTDCVT